ncbi:hypothetical protein LUZ60_010703 [Juncus effusus]|nr:hypothetical protein LUZ60_010703 [Juncus effusus]
MYQPHQSRGRYYRNRVQESLTSRFAKCVCSLFLSLLLIVGVIFFVLWLSLRPHRPRFHLGGFSIAGLSQSTGLVNSPVTFNLTDHNSNAKIGIFYDSMYASVYYNDKQIGSGPVLSPFYQPPKNTTSILGTITTVGPTVNDSSWDLFSADVAAGQVALQLKLTSTISFKVKVWDTKKHHLHVVCKFKVGKDGNILGQYVNEKCPIYF